MNNRIVILGGGESGAGAAVLAKDKGFDVFVSDFGTIPAKYRDLLDSEGIAWEQGGHTMERILDAGLVVKSPGIAKETPVMQAVAQKGIPVVSEIEFAGRYTDAKMVCITGSNGKTTTTLLTHHILNAAGIDAGLAGNVGRSLALQVARDPHPVYVIELSSFQLDNMYDFRADIAILLNITPDHLDRYEHSMDKYADAKLRILQNQRPTDAFIYWKDDPVTAAKLRTATVTAARYPFAETDNGDDKDVAAWVDDAGMLNVRTPRGLFAMPRAELSLPGLHNLYNSMAAALAARLCGVEAESLRKSLADFPGVEHRLEFVRDLDGVRWINDSKATNVASAYYALQSMTTPTVLILGGKDKGNDYSEILDQVHQKVKHIVAMGLHNEKIVDFFGGIVPVDDTHTLADAVAACRAAARPGDTVLLSPCCASFDLFTSYEDRGRRFKDAVHALK